MLKLNLSSKLVLGYSMIAILLLICGYAGYSASQKLSLVSDFLVNEARITVKGALQTTSSSESMSEVTQKLNHLAGQLSSIVGQFKI